MVFEEMVNKFEEHIEYLTQANDAIQSFISKVKEGFANGGIQGKLGGFLK